MTPQEINDIFKIDIKSKNRQILNVYLRALYVKKMRPDTTFMTLSKELGLTHSAIINGYKKLDLYSKDPLFKYAEKAFKTKNIAFVYEFRKFTFKKIAERAKKNYDIKTSVLNKPKVVMDKKYSHDDDRVSLDFNQPERDDILIVAKNLRFKKTYLNNKYFNEWTGRDWSNYNNLIK